MTRKPRSPDAPRPRNREATEAALIAAATEVFAERGFDAATTKGIAQRAGYSEGLIQAYFQGKEGLLLAVIQSEGAAPDEVAAFCARPLRATIEEDARETMRFSIAILARRSAGLRIVFARGLRDPAFMGEFARIIVRSAIVDGLERRFVDYRAQGKTREDLDPRVAAELLMSLGFDLGFVRKELFPVSPTEAELLFDGFAALFDRACRVIPQSS